MPLTANQIWRDFETDGVGSSGAHKPIKADIRAWGSALEAIGGFNVPGADTTAALFSGGTGVAPVWRKIVGFDLPNPSTTVPGAVFAKPATAGQILAGLGTDGEFDTASTTGTGSIVLSDNPNFTTGVRIGGLQFLSSTGGTHAVVGPDGRLAFQASGTPPAINYYKATTHQWFDSIGSDLFAQLDKNTFELQPATLTGSQTNSAFRLTQTWNQAGSPPPATYMVFLTMTNVAANPGSSFIRCDTQGVNPGMKINFDIAGSLSLAGNIASNGVFVLNGKNFASVNGSGGLDRYCSAVGGGIRWLTENGARILESLSNVGDHEYWGSTSGSHLVRAPAAAAGVSTWPTTSGELVNTGKASNVKILQSTINVNAANTDYPITIPLPMGVRFFRVSAAWAINVGTTASLTAATYGIFSAAAGGGTAYTATAPLNGITSNTPNTAARSAALSLGTLPTYLWESNQTIYFRTLVAQGTAATIDIVWTLELYA